MGSITGYSFDGVGYDVVTAKISGATGQPLWGPVVYDSGFDDFPDRVASDPAGNVILAGHSSVLAGAAVLAPEVLGLERRARVGPGDAVRSAELARGRRRRQHLRGELWRRNHDDEIRRVDRRDPLGTLLGGRRRKRIRDGPRARRLRERIRDGQPLPPATSADYAVIKYRGSDGTVLWGPVTYDGGAGRDFPYAIVVDGSGNAVVTGSSETGSNERRSATLSYDGATGALRWGPVGQNIAREAVNGLAASGSTIFVGATRGDVGYLVTALDEALGIATLSDDVPAASCGHAIDLPVVASNGTRAVFLEHHGRHAASQRHARLQWPPRGHAVAGRNVLVPGPRPGRVDGLREPGLHDGRRPGRAHRSDRRRDGRGVPDHAFRRQPATRITTGCPAEGRRRPRSSSLRRRRRRTA